MASRPLSPHLQIYKLPLPALLSITHRLTGLFLVLTVWILIIGLSCLTCCPEKYQQYYGLFSNFLGKGFIVMALASFYFHLLNGIRHLFWDVGLGFSLKATYISGITVLIATAILTGLTFFY